MLASLTRRVLFCTGLALALSACSQETDVEKTLYFSAIPGENTSEMIEKFSALATHLTTVLEVEVTYVHVSDYVASVEAFKNGDVQLAWFGGLTGVRARRAVEGAHAIAQGKVDPTYKSYFIANKASGLRPSEEFPMELATKTFQFGDESSTSGRLMPEYFIRKFTGKSPAEFFGSPMSFSGSHDRTWQLVQEGTYDAGVMSYVTYDTRVKEGKIDPEKCFVIWKTPEYADYSWHAHPDLETRFGAGFTEKVQTALINIKDKALLSSMMREDGLIKAADADFSDLETLAAELGLIR
jgi:phosphonate transport system substrate-binding protein